MGRPKRKAPSQEEMAHFTWTGDHVAAASLAYKKNNSSDMDDQVKLSEGWHHYKTMENPNGTCYKIWVSPSNGNVMLSFRGTSNLQEAKIDSTVGSTVFKSAKGVDIGHVYKGFGDAWDQIKDQITTELRYLKSTTFLNIGSTLQFSGHSLGGALSDIASTYYADMFPNVQVIETSIGAPTSGDKAFVNYAMLQDNVKRTRIISPGDPVANLKLPGMEYMPTPYVIDVGLNADKKKRKFGLYDVFQIYATTVNPALGLTVSAVKSAKDGADEHGLDRYTAKLTEDFKSHKVQTVDSDEFKSQKEEDKRIHLKNSSMALIDGSCQCECHNCDEAVASGAPLPQSLGSIQQSQDPARIAMQTTDAMDTHGESYNAAGQQVNQSDQDILNQQAQDMMDTTADADMNGIRDLVNSSLEKQAAKDDKELTKLQDKYATLTNQDIADADPVTQTREAYSRRENDMAYYNERIKEELESPNTVPNDNPLDNASASTARDTAIKFKNNLNQLYASIMSSQSYEDSRQLDTNLTDQDRASGGRQDAIIDQEQDQIPQAIADGILDDEHQSGDYVFNYKLLGDLNNVSDNAKKQITEWLAYPGISEGTLYEALKKQMTTDYKTTRLDALMMADNDLKAKSVDDLREKITKQQSDIRLNSQQRDQFSQYVSQMSSSNESFKSMITSGQVNIDKMMADYKGKESEITLNNEILGYDPATRGQTLKSEYDEGVREIQSQALSPEETGKAMAQLAEIYGILEDVPWLDKADLDKIYKEHPDEYERDKAIEEASNEKANNLGSKYYGEEEKKLNVDLNKDASFNYDYRDEIKDGVYEDGWEKRRQELDKKYSDPDKLKAMFEQWNRGDKTDGKNISDTVVNGILGGPFNPMFWSSLDNLQRDRKTGWFTADGERLGLNASPDFTRYVSEHPELGLHYIDAGGHNPYVEKVNGVVNSVVGLAMGAEFGVPMGPMDVANMVSGVGGLDSKGPSGYMGVLDGYLGSNREGPPTDQGPSKTEEKITEVAQMAAMMALQRVGTSARAKAGVNTGAKPAAPKVGGETTGKTSSGGFGLGLSSLKQTGQAKLNSAKETFNNTTTSMRNKLDTMRNESKGFTSLGDIPRVPANKITSLPSRAKSYVKDYLDERATNNYIREGRKQYDAEERDRLIPVSNASQKKKHSYSAAEKNKYNMMI